MGIARIMMSAFDPDSQNETAAMDVAQLNKWTGILTPVEFHDGIRANTELLRQCIENIRMALFEIDQE